MKALIAFLSLFLFVLTPQGALAKERVLPYKLWKQKKILEAKSIVMDLKRESKHSSKSKVLEDDAQDSVSRKLFQAELNLGVVKELSANDYFVLYVYPNFKDDRDAIVQAAKSLNTKDMVDVLESYQKKIQGPDLVENGKTTTMNFMVPGFIAQ